MKVNPDFKGLSKADFWVCTKALPYAETEAIALLWIKVID